MSTEKEENKLENNDYLIRATAGEGSVRIFFAMTKEMANKSFEIHQTSPVVSAAMGRLLTATAMIGSMQKGDEDILTISLKGDGPMKGIVATGDSKGNVKGYPYVSLVDIPLKPSGKLDVGTAIGMGNLTIIRDLGLKEPYVGQIPLISGEIADDLTYYYAKSEQIPTSVALGVLVDKDLTIKQSGGFIIQMMPDALEEYVDKLEYTLAHLPSLTSLLEEGKTGEDIIDILAGDIGYTINEKSPIQYYCNCSKERVEKALIAVGLKDLKEIIEEDGQAELNCHFCGEKYQFNLMELNNLVERLVNNKE